jgi:hypothetical protein
MTGKIDPSPFNYSPVISVVERMRVLIGKDKNLRKREEYLIFMIIKSQVQT